MVSRSIRIPALVIFYWAFACQTATGVVAGDDASPALARHVPQQGVCVLLGATDAAVPLSLAEKSEAVFLVQASDDSDAESIRNAASDAGLLGVKIYVTTAPAHALPLAANLADAVLVLNREKSFEELPADARREILRVLHPGGEVFVGDVGTAKPFPEGSDDWSHPYHGPDNNPQSNDAHAKAPYLTQFLSEPWYVPMPQVTVASGGRVFKAFGHIALKEREWPWLNTLAAINGYNGALLWRRPLTPGFMIHRNTLIATPDTLYLADDASCKILNAADGELRGEIKISPAMAPDGVWKWMAFENGVLYAIIGPPEKPDPTIRGARKLPGWPWKDLGQGYASPYAWGFGHTLLAINPETKQVLWKRSSADPIDSRAACMADGRIYLYCHEKSLTSVDASTGQDIWTTTNTQLLAAIGQHDRAQTPGKGFASSSYAKANRAGIYFAGPQRTHLVAVSAQDGSLMWSYPHGNFQLVLRHDALYAMGRTQTSKKFDYLTGRVLADLDCYRGNCTRATGAVDSIFTRGYRHTGTMRLDLSGNQARRIPLMRPACQDGVIIADGQLYWGPWMCDCNHSLIGMISLASAADFKFNQTAVEEERLASSSVKVENPLEAEPDDWPGYRANSGRTAASSARAPAKPRIIWSYHSPSGQPATAPITAAGLVFWSGLDGVVHAADAATGKVRWRAFTGAAVRFPPEFHQGRIYIGSGDGAIYCFDAASGNQLWKFRAAPAERSILVHGRLLSNWPVGSGVLLHKGVLYAAAGITSYDGTHVYALDAKTGKIRWQNNTSGRLVSGERVTGVSVQGHLLLHNERLYLAGGNVVSPAIYDLQTGACLNKLENEWWDRPPDAKERFPAQPKNREMFQRAPRGRELFLVDGQVRVFDQLLYSPPKYGPSRYFGGHFLQAQDDQSTIRGTTGQLLRLAAEKNKDGQPLGLWRSAAFRDPLALAVCANSVLAAGEKTGPEGAPAAFAVAALDKKSGRVSWSVDLPAAPVSWGLAPGPRKRIFVALENGAVVGIGD